MAKAVVEWLEKEGWDVYQEVECRGGVADIVALRDNIVRIVECKLTFSFASMAQALSHYGQADELWLAMPDYWWVHNGAYRRSPDGWDLGWRIADEKGIGVLLAGSREPNRVVIKSAAKPQKMIPLLRTRLLGSLRPQHKTFAAAGSPTGARFTPFKETCENIVKFMATKPQGCSLAHLAANVKHHYRLPKHFVANMKRLMLREVVKGVHFETDPLGGPYTVFPDTASEPVSPEPVGPARPRSLRSQLRAL